jgi:hypothetical protein
MQKFKLDSSSNLTSTLSLTVMALLFCSACSSAPTRKTPPREAFLKHWKDAGSHAQVLQVTPMPNGMYRGNGMVDGRPVEEFYDPESEGFNLTPPAQTIRPDADEKKLLYKDLMADLASELNLSIPNNSRIAVLSLPDDAGKQTKLSANLASKLEMGLGNAGRDMIDRGKIDEVIKEHKFQQTQSALFDASSMARLGQFVGANTVLTGSYHLSPNRLLTVTVRAISVETTRVIVVKEKEIPLDGAGSVNRDEISELTRD